MNRRLSAAVITAIALFGLTACTAPSPGGDTGSSASDAPGDGGQSAADACALVQETITTATEEFSSAASADPSAVVEAMSAAATKLAEVGPQVTNDAVAALVPSLEKIFHTTAEVMDGIVKGDISKTADLAELGTSMQETMESFQKVCGPTG